ncbi:MAG: VWA domain-containing protein [Fibrobacteres bacterium]|nr:VWA domain-containing protein [Fibrobacterota bacterium]
MIYRSPEFLWLLLLIPVLFLFYMLAFRAKKRALLKFGSAAMMVKLAASASSARDKLKAALIIAAFIFAVIALARPLWGSRMEEVKRKGIDIVIALDVSNSMLAEDIAPNRIDRAKHEISKLIDKLKGDRVGLVAFAGSAFTQCPVTSDYGAVKMYLNVLDPSAIAAQGTAIGGAVRQSRRAFSTQEAKSKVLILITDGEDNVENPVDEAKKASEEGIVIFALGIGTQGGVPIPLSRQGTQITYKKDESGNTVLTSINDEILEEVAAAAGGRYFRSTGRGLELDRIYSEIEKMEKQEMKGQMFNRYHEQFKWPLALAILLLILEFMIPGRRIRKQQWEGRFTE